MKKSGTLDPKRHHYIPKTLLKRFVDPDGWLFVYSKQQPALGVRRSRIDNAFFRKHLYAQINEDGTKDVSVEKALGSLESRASPILDKLIGCARRNEPCILHEEDRWSWCEFFLSQWKRVPDLHDTVTTDEQVNAQMDTIMGRLRRKYPDRSDELNLLDQDRKKIIRNARISTVLGSGPLSMPVLMARKTCILKIRAPHKRLIIGSRPVVQMNFKENSNLTNTQTEMWLPIASDVVVGVGDGIADRLLFMDDVAGVRALNVAIAQQSTEFASAIPALTQSLANHR